MNQLRSTLPAVWLAVFLLVGASGPLYGQEAAVQADKASARPNGGADKKPAEEPDTVILSDALNYDDVIKESTFTGNVIMTRGLLTLRSDKLVLHEDARGFQYGTATMDTGKLVHVRQEKPDEFEVVKAQGLRAEYSGKTNEIEMIGQAVVTRFVCGKPVDKIKGERVKYYQDTDVYQAFGGPNSAAEGGRVRSVTHPRAKADAALADCKKKSATN